MSVKSRMSANQQRQLSQAKSFFLRKEVQEMKNKTKVSELIEALKAEAETLCELSLIEKLGNQLTNGTPEVEVIDENTQIFLGTKYSKKRSGHLFNTFSIHRAVWSYYNGEIPIGYDVHHIDGNKVNNELSNLELLNKSEHHKKHWASEGKVKLICAQCGKEFLAHRRIRKGYHTFCSKECGLKWRGKPKNRTHETKICKNCGKEYQGRKGVEQQFCSRECHYEFQRKKKVRIKKCEFCGNDFLAKHKIQKFCSAACQGKAQRVSKIAVCQFCGKEFESSKYLTQKYCSLSCKSKAMWATKKNQK